MVSGSQFAERIGYFSPIQSPFLPRGAFIGSNFRNHGYTYDRQRRIVADGPVKEVRKAKCSLETNL